MRGAMGLVIIWVLILNTSEFTEFAVLYCYVGACMDSSIRVRDACGLPEWC